MNYKKQNSRCGITRRDFIKWSAAAGAAGKAINWTKAGPSLAALTVAKTVRNICPYCSIGCGVKVDVDSNDKILDIYGDELHVINRGSLCSKGSSLYQLVDPDGSIGARVTEPRIKLGDGINGDWYRHSQSAEQGWLDIFGLSSWGSTSYIDNIDMTKWEGVATGLAPSGVTSARTLPWQMANSRGTGHANVTPDKVAYWGSSHMTNEECYLYRKLIPMFGTNSIEHQARI